MILDGRLTKWELRRCIPWTMTIPNSYAFQLVVLGINYQTKNRDAKKEGPSFFSIDPSFKKDHTWNILKIP